MAYFDSQVSLRHAVETLLVIHSGKEEKDSFPKKEEKKKILSNVQQGAFSRKEARKKKTSTEKKRKRSLEPKGEFSLLFHSLRMVHVGSHLPCFV